MAIALSAVNSRLNVSSVESIHSVDVTTPLNGHTSLSLITGLSRQLAGDKTTYRKINQDACNTSMIRILLD
jgi:hypothetical protein